MLTFRIDSNFYGKKETESGLAFQQFPIGQALSAVSDSQAMLKTETGIGLAE